MALKFKVHRTDGVDGPVTVLMEWRPPGVSPATPVTVPAGQTEGTYLLGAARSAAPGGHPVTLTAVTGSGRRGYYDGDGRAYVASRPFRLTVAEPHVEARIARTSIERGQTATLVCKLNHLQPFTGTARATPARLPRGVELVEPVREVTSAEKEVRFTLRATSGALVGNLLPPNVVFAGKGQAQRTVVLAKYADGSVRDVTRLALYLTNNESIAAIGKDGVVKAGGRGGAFVFARFGKFTVGSEVIVLPTGDDFRWPDPPEQNSIDALVFDKLKKLHMAPSELCTDEAFLRRAYLDLVGLPPGREEYDRFLADTDPQKRQKLIDALLERPEFVDVWAMKWGELLRVRAYNQVPQHGRDAKAMFAYAAWVKDQMANNRPLDRFAAELLVGTGSNFKSLPANLYTAAERLTPEKTAEDIAQVFLGTRIQCARCHNHPFDRWTMDDYYGFAAFCAGVQLRRGVEGREARVANNNAANTVAHPVDGRRMKPKFLGGAAPDVEGKDPRTAPAAWLASPDNAAFRETMANVIWAHFFGRGIVEPVDDLREDRPGEADPGAEGGEEDARGGDRGAVRPDALPQADATEVKKAEGREGRGGPRPTGQGTGAAVGRPPPVLRAERASDGVRRHPVGVVQLHRVHLQPLTPA